MRPILTHPLVYPHLHDDTAPPREEWKMIEHPLLSYMLVRHCGAPVGVFIVAAHSAILWEIHEAFLPRAWGGAARRAARMFRDWIWRETRCQRLIGSIPAYNRPAIAFALASGMETAGVHPRCYLHDGKLEDLILVGISRPMETA